MAILGLMNSEDFTAQRDFSVRRRVFYDYPNGAAVLTGFLSLMKEETCNDPKYTWFEKRLKAQSSAADNISTTVVFYSTVNADFSTWTTATANFTFTQTTNGSTPQYGVKVESTDCFRVNHIIQFEFINASAATEVCTARVTNVDHTNTRLAFVVISATAAAATDYDEAHDGNAVMVVGSSYAEGALSSEEGTYTLPLELSNYTQIFRTPFSFTRTALKTGTRFDKTGTYMDKAKDHSIAHMVEMEKAFLFGEKHLFTNGDGLPVRSTQGLIPFLEEWEAGSTYGNVGAATDAEEARIIDVSGNITDVTYSSYLERLFRTTSNSSSEKLVLCGNKFLMHINQLYKNNSVLNTDLPMTDTYGTNVVKHLTPFGTIYYKTHPLFNQYADLRNNALFLDVHNLKYRYLEDSDTTLLKNRQANDADLRKDEWLTEAGLEINFPESHMYIKNVTGAA